VFLGVMASPAEHPHFLYHAGLDAKAGHYRACEPSPESADSQAPALHAGVRDYLTRIVSVNCMIQVLIRQIGFINLSF